MGPERSHMTNLGLLIISACKAVHTHQEGEDVGTIEVRGQLDAVGRKYIRITRRLLAKARVCPAVVSEAALREEANRWKRGHRDCAAQLARVVDLDERVVAEVLYLYREAIKRGWVSKFGDWILEMSKLETGIDSEDEPTNRAATELH